MDAAPGQSPLTQWCVPALSMPASSVWVYAPPGYDSSGSAAGPVVYLVHGDPATSADLADWQHRIIGGMSAGGFCALDQGLRHLGVWGGIVSLEGYGDPGEAAATDMGYDTAAFRRVSPVHYISTMTFPRRVAVMPNVGELDDPQRVEVMADELEARGQSVVFRVEAGQDHSWAVARMGVPYGLAHVGQDLGWTI